MIKRIAGRRILGDRRGNAMIEFALAFVVLVPLFLGSYEFGYAFYVYNSLQSGVRAGARYAAFRTYDSATDTPSDDYTLSVQNVVVYGDPTGGEEPIVPGLSPEDVSVDMTFVDGIPWDVTIGIPDWETNAVVEVVDFAEKPRLTVPFTGRWDPTL